MERSPHSLLLLLGALTLVPGCPHDFTLHRPDLGGADAPLADMGDAAPDTLLPDTTEPVDLGCQDSALCSGGCVDTSSSVKHCGGCGQACAAGQDCVGGSCACTVGGNCYGCCDGDTCVPYGNGQSLTRCGTGGEPCKSCDDQLACSTDACNSVGICQNTPVAGQCLVQGSCVPDGTFDPASTQCLQCQSTLNPLAWTGVPNKGCVATLAGTDAPGFQNGPAHQALFNLPRGLALDSAGALHVADSGNRRIRKIAGGQVSTFAGTGVSGLINGLLDKARFNCPSGLAFDSAGALHVTDNHCLRKIANGWVSTLAGSGYDGFQNGPALSAWFNWPDGVAVDGGGVVYVADEYNHLIRKIAGGQVSTFAGDGTAGLVNGSALTAKFYRPRDLVLGATGALHVADAGNHCIRKIAGGKVSTWAGDGTAGFANGSLATARFNTPGGLTVDGAGAVLVADTHNHRIRKIAGGQVTTVAGDGTAGFADGPLAKARFNQPIRLAVDGSGKIYVADRENHRIRVIVP